MLFAKREDPVLDDAGCEFVENADLIGGHLHPLGDGFDDFVVVHLPVEPGADESRNRPRPCTGFAADADVAESSGRKERISGFEPNCPITE